MKVIGIIVFAGLVSVCYGANILVVAPMPTRSHYHLFDKMAVQLTKRGHGVTIIACFKQSKPVPNLEEVVVDNLYEETTSTMSSGEEGLKSKQMSVWRMLFFLPAFGQFLSDGLLKSEKMKKFLKEDRKYDLIIGESFVIESLIGGLAHKYNAPHIILSPFISNYWCNYMVGNTAPPSYIPDPLAGIVPRMGFKERLLNTVYVTINGLFYTFDHIPKQDAIMRKYFGSHLPPLSEIMKNTSFVLVNHHHSLHYPKPYVPNMIEIGGYHVMPPKPLPEDLKKLMDESRHGVIYFSFGSHLKSSDMTPKMISSVLAAFSRLKQDVLWKFEKDLENVPKNVKIMKWLPQSDILAHPKLKLFVTHGGLLSTIESVTRGVPLVGVPIMGDQPTNLQLSANLGYAVILNLDDLDEEHLYAAIQEVLTNPKYNENAKRLSRILQDRPLQAMDTAMFWIEYVLRHKGAPHLRSHAQDLKWYEFYLIDVIGFISAVAFVVVYVIYHTLRLVCGGIGSFLTKSKKKTESSKKKN